MDELIEEEIGYDDSTPSVLEQAEKEGWKAGYYNFGKAEGGRDWFNPSIVRREDGIWLIVRGSEPHPQGFPFGQNSIWAFMMDDTGKVPKKGIRLRWKDAIPDQHFEDPRGFYHPGIDQTIISACTFVWYPDRTWTGAHQCIGSFDEAWECSKMDYPMLGGSSGRLEMITDKKRYEKNWLPFLHEGHLHILYKASPWMIVGYGSTWSDRKAYENEGVGWGYGDVRGGTSPVKIGDYYITFPHSSLMWRGRYRRYYAGAMAFDAKPPFAPRMITPEPLLRGSQNDVWAQKKPLVIFPCGALYRKGTWLITCGVNDMKAAWVEIPHEDILKRMIPIGETTATVFPATGLSDAEKRLAKLRANLVKARAARAAKNTAKRAELAEKLKSVSEEKVFRALYGEPSQQALIEQEWKEETRIQKGQKIAERMAANGTDGERQTGGLLDLPPHGTKQPSVPRRRRRRKRRTKAQMAAARLKALEEYENEKANKVVV